MGDAFVGHAFGWRFDLAVDANGQFPPSPFHTPPSPFRPPCPVPTLPVTPEEIALAIVLAMIGSIVQGSIGFGLAVVSAPILMMIDPVFVPGPLLMAASLLVVLIAHRDRRAAVRRDVALGIVGRILGTLPAAYALSIMPGQYYSVLFATLVLLAVGLSLSGWHLPPTPRNVIAAATLSGFASTVASLGGAPMALVYQKEEGPKVRGTMSAIFIAGTLVSIAGLWWAGMFGRVELLLGLMMMPGIAIGFALSRYTARYIDGEYFRPALLVVSAASGVAILVRALL